MYTACPVFLYCVFLCFLRMEAMITKEAVIKGTIRSLKEKSYWNNSDLNSKFFTYLRISPITASAAMVSSTSLFRLLPSKTWGVVLLWLFSRILILIHASCILFFYFLSVPDLVTDLIKVLDNLAEFHLHRRMWASHFNSGVNSTIATCTKIMVTICQHKQIRGYSYCDLMIFCFKRKQKLNF